MRVWRLSSSSATRLAAGGGVATSDSSIVEFARFRTDAASLPTTASSIALDSSVETTAACEVAVIPTIMKNAPKTSVSRIGRRLRDSEPNTFSL